VHTQTAVVHAAARRGTRQATALEAHGADVVVNDLAELLEGE
jgi:phosphoglycolate phosphatase-like HAD superfamily hydrolase